MNGNTKTTAMWISIVFAVLVAAVGWVFGFSNLSSDGKLGDCVKKLNVHESIIMELREEKATTNNELKNINRRLERIERLIEENNK